MGRKNYVWVYIGIYGRKITRVYIYICGGKYIWRKNYKSRIYIYVVENTIYDGKVPMGYIYAVEKL